MFYATHHVIYIFPFGLRRITQIYYQNVCPTQQREALLDAPIYPNASKLVEKEQIQGGYYTKVTTFETESKAEEVADFYKQSLDRAGWMMFNEEGNRVFMYEESTKLPLHGLILIIDNSTNKMTKVEVNLTREPCIRG